MYKFITKCVSGVMSELLGYKSLIIRFVRVRVRVQFGEEISKCNNTLRHTVGCIKL